MHLSDQPPLQITDTTENDVPIVPYSKTVYVWSLRLLLAVLLLFGTEILLWSSPDRREWAEWLYLIPGYIALATFMLDVAVRYRIRNVYDGLLIAGMYAVLNALLLNPTLTQADFPRTFMTRVMGGYLVFGAEMLGLFLILTAGFRVRYQRLLIGYAIWLGFFWGVWMRWTPEFGDWFQRDIGLDTMFAYASVPIVVAFALFFFSTRYKRHTPVETSDMMLSPLGWTILVGVFLVQFIMRVLEDAILAQDAIFATLFVLSVTYAMLYFRRSDKGRMMLEWHIPPTPMSLVLIMVSLLIFGAMTVVGYEIPLVKIGSLDQLRYMELLFVGVGFAWLPTVAIAVAIPAIDRQWRQSE